MLFRSGGITTVSAGAALSVNGNLAINLDLINDGTLTVNGTLVAGTGVNAFTNNGLIKGTGTINLTAPLAALGRQLLNNGTVAPGASPGKLTILGDYVQTALGTLSIELAGTVQGVNYDWLAVSGNAILDGALAVAVPGGFTPTTADLFRFVTAGLTRSGTFTSVVPPAGYGGAAIYGAAFTDLGFTAIPAPTNTAADTIVTASLPVVLAELSRNIDGALTRTTTTTPTQRTRRPDEETGDAPVMVCQ